MLPGHPHLKLVTNEFMENAAVPRASIKVNFSAGDETCYIDSRCKRRYKRKLRRQRRG